jgi:hypothetical protein
VSNDSSQYVSEMQEIAISIDESHDGPASEGLVACRRDNVSGHARCSVAVCSASDNLSELTARINDEGWPQNWL